MGKGTHLFAISVLPAITLVACSEPPVEEGVTYTSMRGTTGCLIEQITTEPFGEYQFQGASPDGQWLSYAWDNGEDAEGNPIRGSYNLNLITGEKTELPPVMSNVSTFSPDGKYLLGAHYTDDGRTDLYEMNLETGEITALAVHPQWDWLPTYSPDGTMIAFDSYRIDGEADMFLYDRATGELQRFTNYEGYDAHPEFSPDGSKVLFHRMISGRPDGGYNFDLFTYDLATGQETQLTSSIYEESYGSWAPDGQHIVFSSDPDEAPEQSNLYVLAPDGMVLLQLTDGNWKDWYAFWTRDGKYIYFNSERGGNTDIYRMPMNGLNCVQAG